MATTSFTKNFKLKKRDSNNFVIGMTSKVEPILDPNFKTKAVDNAEYKKVVEAFKRS